MNKKFVIGMAAVVLTSSASTFAKTTDPSVYDKIWSNVDLVDTDDDSVIQKFSLTGRLQGDAYSFHSEDNNNDNFVWRRFRFGFKAKLLEDVIVHTELDLNMNHADAGNSWNDFYTRLTDSYVAWEPSKTTAIKVGKQSAGFTLDGATSSKKLIVPERSIVAGNLWFGTEYFTGVQVSGNSDGWSYKAGGFSSSGEAEYGHFQSGYFGLLSAGHKVGEKGSIRVDYVYNDPDYSGINKNANYTVGTKKLEQILSVSYKQMLSEKTGISSGLSGAKGITDMANGINQGDLIGLEIMPFYNISEAFQLVFQYAGVTSLDNMSDVSMSRYASRTTTPKSKTKVETAHNVLLGFNWYLYGHKLKWQNAVEYNYGSNLASTGDNYNGYGVTSAFRLSW